MHWKTKSKIQNAIAILPKSISYSLYYWIQRNYGNLRNPNPTKRMMFAIESWNKIKDFGINPVGKIFFETGTGRMPVVPISYWLMGAEKIITVDLNPYLKEELVIDVLEYIKNNKRQVINLFAPISVKNRLDALERFANESSFSLGEFLNYCNIEYIAPCDASNTSLPDDFIDFHVSNTVFEHIPEDVLLNILKEGNRITKQEGLFINRIDYTDHFSHSDNSISEINFLQYSEKEWESLAGNRYMYMNRLRHNDYLRLFELSGHSVCEVETYVNNDLLKVIEKKDFKISDDFILKSKNELIIIGAWIVSRFKEMKSE